MSGYTVRLEPSGLLGQEPGSRLYLSASMQAPIRVASFEIECEDASASTVAVVNITVGAVNLMARPSTILVIEPEDDGRRLVLDLDALRLPSVNALAGTLVLLEVVRVSSARSLGFGLRGLAVRLARPPSVVRAVVRGSLPA